MSPVVSLPAFALENCTVSLPSAAAMPLFSAKFGYQVSLTNADGESVLMAFESAAEQQAWSAVLGHFKPTSDAALALKVRLSVCVSVSVSVSSLFCALRRSPPPSIHPRAHSGVKHVNRADASIG